MGGIAITVLDAAGTRRWGLAGFDPAVLDGAFPAAEIQRGILPASEGPYSLLLEPAGAWREVSRERWERDGSVRRFWLEPIGGRTERVGREKHEAGVTPADSPGRPARGAGGRELMALVFITVKDKDGNVLMNSVPHDPAQAGYAWPAAPTEIQQGKLPQSKESFELDIQPAHYKRGHGTDRWPDGSVQRFHLEDNTDG